MTSLRLKNVSAGYHGKAVVNDCSFEAKAGQVTVLIGPNGAGKSTVLKAACNLVPILKGAVLANDLPLTQLSKQETAQLIAYLPQNGEVHWPLTVENLVALGRLPHLPQNARQGDADIAAIEGAISSAAVEPFRKRSFHSLSGGEKSRVLFARALAQQAPILLADEPIAALDPRHQLTFMHLLKAEAAKGRTVVVTVHDIHLAARFADQVCLMDEGEIVACGDPDSVLTDALLEKVYGVRMNWGNTLGAILPWEVIDS